MLGSLTALLSYLIIGDFSHPLSDGNDTDQFEYVGYFFARNLRFTPFPHLMLDNTQTFYPYGTNQVFLDWGFERDYWYTICYDLWGGAGPYLQYYYGFTLVLTAIGTFILLRSRFGIPKAFGVGLIVSVFNAYAIYKFPVHMNVCVGHWTTLCILATYRLLYDVVHRNPISLPYLLAWIWLHLQTLAQELGYVAGFALTFTTLVVPVLLVLLYRRYGSIKAFFQTGMLAFPAYLTDQWQQRQPYSLFWIGLIGLSGYLYLPLTFQIAFTAWQFDFGSVPALRAWSHPLRLLIPHLPVFHFYILSKHTWFKDYFESYGQGSPGLYLLLLAGLGFWQIRKQVWLWIPVVVTLLLCLLYHPVVLPTLKIFPWFSFNRHGGRASLVYPVLLCILALPLRWPSQNGAQWALAAIGVLMLTEWFTILYPRTQFTSRVASDPLLRYCARIKQQPGVAVLDWPFCTVGGNGVGAAEGLCPFYDQQNAVFTFRRFYDKSGVGQYFGRLHPNQISPFLRDGWPKRLTPGYLFTQADWDFMDHFLQQHNFAGINLYLDLLSPSQQQQFFAHYGQPVAHTRFPMAGRVVFIPLTPFRQQR